MIATQISIPGYSIKEELYNGSRTLVYRAIRDLNEKPVVIKLLKNPYPNFNELLQFRNQYTIAKNLDIPGIVDVYSLEAYQNSYALVMEDFGGVSLQEYIKTVNITSVKDLLSIGVQITDILHNLHQNHVIHKDIKPANILINPETKEVKLIDFSIASLLPKETQEIKNPNGLEGTLAYISPEQTGRMNRGIDYRSDFYALGVTFYELLTGELPFKSDDAMELVHCHIAKMPPIMGKPHPNPLLGAKPHPNPLLGGKPHPNPLLGKEREQEIPQVLSDIVMKLMAKNAEDRYQSALGLKYDLEVCLKQLQETGNIENFQIAQRDICDKFIIPEKLYGRETEIKDLLAAFERVSGVTSRTSRSLALPGNAHQEALPLVYQEAEPLQMHYKAEPCNEGNKAEPCNEGNKAEPCNEGKAELMLVAGFSGIGKTAVVNEVHKPIVKQRGYFIKGKFDQFNRNIPYCAFVQALRNLIGQLLSETDTQLLSWKSKILQALGENGQIIIDVIPELEQIIGKQPPAPELSGAAAQNRFNLLFQKFIQVFTAKEHPLVIFLDDLQWADSASLQLMQLLMSESETNYLLLIGAYRDNEVFPAHPLMLTLEEIGKAQGNINTIILTALSAESLNQLVADTLNCQPLISQPLTQLIYRKTQGNPFFSTQFLKGLYDDELIKFDFDNSSWGCDISQLRTLALTDDVVEFMGLRLRKLPESTQNVLKLAACIGNQFDLATLAIICEKSEAETANYLWKALQEGLILPQSEVYKFYLESEDSQITSYKSNYKFLHDRVQQAAYSLIAEEDRQKTHLQIGQLLLQRLSQSEKSERVFDLVNQLNLGQAAIKTAEEKQQLARLNLEAGKKAKLSGAYQAAENYCFIGMNLLSANSWQTDYKLIYNLYLYGSEAAYLSGNFEQAETLYAKALTHAQTPLDKAIIYRVQMTQYQLQGRNSEAIEIQRQSLQLLGWEMPTEQELIQASLDEEINQVQRFLEQQTVALILNFPKMEDSSIAEILRILQILFYSAWLDGQPTLALLAIAKMTTLSLQYGNSDMSPFGYVGYGLIANTMLKDSATAYQFGEMAVQLCEQFDNADVRGMTNFLFAADVHSWSRPIREADTYYNNAYKYGMEAGNWLTVGFMMMQSGSDRLTYGKNLDELYGIAQAHADFLRQIKSLENLDALIVGVIQPIRNLLGLTKIPLSFDDESFSEAEFLQKYSNAPYHLAWLYSVKIRHAYLFDDKAAYPDLISQLSIIENAISSHAKVPSSVFYVALMHLTLIETTTEDSERQLHWQALALLEEKLKLWAKACPENILHKCLLIQAEKARLNGKKAEVIDLYEQAMTKAQTNLYIYEEGLANELAAKFYLDWGKEKVAAGYMQEAYYCYARWGAKAKTDDLEKRYPQLLTPILQTQQNSFHINETQIPTLQTIQTTRSSSTISDTLDFASILKSTQALSSEIQLEDLISTLLQIVIENAGSEKAALIYLNEDNLILEAIATKDNGVTHLSIPYENCFDIPHKVINYVKRSFKQVVLDNATVSPDFMRDEYIIQQQPKSLLCTPILDRGKLVGLLYLENKLTRGAFTPERLQVIKVLSTQAAISLENARLYKSQQETNTLLNSLLQTIPDFFFAKDLNGRHIAVNANIADFFGKPIAEIIGKTDAQLLPPEVAEPIMAKDREIITKEINESFEEVVPTKGENCIYLTVKKPLKDLQGTTIGMIGISRNITDRKQAELAVIKKSQELEKALQELNIAQLQMVQNEKMATLGNLVAGVAHEVNNPIGFLKGSISNAEDYIKDLFAYIECYQENYPNPEEEIVENAEDIDLEFLCDDLPKLLNSMRLATERIKDISTSLRTFSRADTSEKIACNMHEGIDSTILILKYRLKANEKRPAIEIIKKYGELPPIKCFLGQLNQVFMNIIANAIDALDTVGEEKTFAEIEANPHKITIQTELITEENTVLISIKDNGCGMPESVRERIFDNLFTTKGVGKGTGLGLAIARSIVEETHSGKLSCNSTLGEGTEFVIELPV
jgi:PAS domain S-box-containing protein